MHFHLTMWTKLHNCPSSSALVCLVLLLLLFLEQLQLGVGTPLLSVAFRRTHMHRSTDDGHAKGDDNNNNNNNNLFDQLNPPLNHNGVFAGERAQKRQQYEKQLLFAMIKQYHEALISDRKAAAEAATSDTIDLQKQQVDSDQKATGTDSTLDSDQDKQKQEQEQHEGTDEPQMVGMRALHSWHGYWDWIEAETHSVYVFAFTYFGVITLVLVGMLIMVSCCYMYDCLGCYDPSLASGQKWRSSTTDDGDACASNAVFPVMAPPPPYGHGGTPMQHKNGTGTSRSSCCSSVGRRWSSPIAQL